MSTTGTLLASRVLPTSNAWCTETMACAIRRSELRFYLRSGITHHNGKREDVRGLTIPCRQHNVISGPWRKVRAVEPSRVTRQRANYITTDAWRSQAVAFTWLSPPLAYAHYLLNCLWAGSNIFDSVDVFSICNSNKKLWASTYLQILRLFAQPSLKSL
jgi:hypothetical protein